MKTDRANTETALSTVVFPTRPSLPPPDQEQRKRPLDVSNSVSRHRTLVTWVTLLALLATGTFVVLRAGTTYTATSYVYVSPTFPSTLSSDENKEQDRPYEEYIADEAQTVTRYDILATALQKLAPGTWQEPGESIGSAVNRLQHALDTDRVGTTFQITIALTMNDPQKAASVVNAVTDAFVAKAHSEEFYGRDQRLATLRDERSKLQTQLDQRLAEQAKLMNDLGVAQVGAQDNTDNTYDSNVKRLNDLLAQAKEQRMAAEAQLNAYRGNALNALATDSATTDVGLSTLRQNLEVRRAQLMTAMNGLTPTNPLYLQNQAEIADIDKQLNQNLSTVEGKIADRKRLQYQAEVNRTRSVEQQIEGQLLAETHTATTAAPKFQQAKEVGKDIQRLQDSYSAVAARIRDLELESSSPGTIHLSSPAMVPLTPGKNRTWLYALGALVFSLLAGVGSALLADALDPYVYTSRDVEQVIGFPPIGVLLDHDDFSSEASGQYLLRLAGGIQHARNSSGARTFLFTATASESGTTTVVEKLGRQLRNLGLNTLTVAATNIDGKIAYVRNEGPVTSSEPGATRYSDKLRRAGADLAVQGGSGTSSPIYSGTFVSQILNEVKDDYDVVLIDASPILISADTEYLARVADGTVLIVQSGRTTRAQLNRAANLLERLDVPGVAVTLNRVSRNRVDAALVRDVEEFQRQLRKQRGTTLVASASQRAERNAHAAEAVGGSRAESAHG
ncbi:MAG: GumC family protein [Acidobacteriaceae bacterium]